MSGASAEALQQLLLARSRDRASLTNNRKKKIRKKLSRVSKSLPEEVREEMCLKRKRDEDAAHASVNCASRTANAPPQASSFAPEQQTALRQARKRLRAVSKARAASSDVLRPCFTGCPPGDGSSSRDTILSSILSMDSNVQVGTVRLTNAVGKDRNWRASCSEPRCGRADQAEGRRGSGGYSTIAGADGGASGVSEHQKPPQHLRVLEMAHEASNVRLADATPAAATARTHAASSTTSSPVCAGSSIEPNELVGTVGDAAMSSTATGATQVAMPSLSVATSSGTSEAGRGEEVTGAGAAKAGGWEWRRTNMSRLAAMVAAVEEGVGGIGARDGQPGVELEGSWRQARELLGSSQGGTGQDWSDLARVLSGGNGAGAPDEAAKGAKAGGNSRGRFAYGNYRRYYGYRLQEGQSEDPRVSVMESGWFHGRRVLDIGCNEGVVTLQAACRFGTASVTGVDIDAALIRKACTLLKRTREAVGAELRRAGSGTQGTRDWAELRRCAAALGRAWFQEMDWMAAPDADRRQLGPMDTVLCLSVTKWVHLHAGDTGLHTLFLHAWQQLAPGGVFVLEPQPWKSYRNAFRNRKVERGAVVDMEELQLRPESFQDHLEKQVGFVFVKQLAVDACSQGFRRPLLVFCKPASAPSWHHGLGRRRP